MNSLIEGFEEFRTPEGRHIKCGICGALERKSIIPHMKMRHNDKWLEWLEVFKEARSKGASFKNIMWDFNRLFSWTVIKKELALADPLLNNHIQIKDFIPLNFRLEETTLWRFPTRGKWANHTHNYPGNWAPQVPRNLILRYSQPNDLVLDPFVGGGTTLIECLLLARAGLGVDVNPRAVAISQLRIRNLRREARRQHHKLSAVKVNTRWGDARNLDFIRDGTVDLICAHPPYMDLIRYTEYRFDDLSGINSIEEYTKEICTVARELFRTLNPKGHCAIMIGDVRKDGCLLPLGFRVLQVFEGIGFKLKDIFIKAEERTSSEEFYKNRLDYPRISHEYIFVFSR